jgi:hypothetical protein
VSDVQDRIERTRAVRRTTVLVVALSAVALVVNLTEGSAGVAAVAAVAITFLLVLMAIQTRQIGALRRRERELNRPRMTPGDYRRLREMETELGWEPSEPPPGAELPPAAVPGRITAVAGPLPGVAALCGSGSLSAPMTGPGGRWRPLSELPKAKAAEHFAQLARVGRESCISYCPVCERRGRDQATAEGIPAAPPVEKMCRELEDQRRLEEDRWEQQ